MYQKFKCRSRILGTNETVKGLLSYSPEKDRLMIWTGEKFVEIDPFMIERFICLDIRGKEIYEGDTVSILPKLKKPIENFFKAHLVGDFFSPFSPPKEIQAFVKEVSLRYMK